MFPVELTTERLRLREFTPADADLLWRYTDDEGGVRFAAPGTFSSVKDARRWLTFMVEAAKKPRRREYRLAVERADTGELIGLQRLSVDVPYDGYGSMGYVLGREHWGHGFGTESAGAALRFGFTTLSLHRVEATIDPDNLGSIRVAEKLGMKLEGRMRERFRAGDGWRDALLYSILDPEWRAGSLAPHD